MQTSSRESQSHCQQANVFKTTPDTRVHVLSSIHSFSHCHRKFLAIIILVSL